MTSSSDKRLQRTWPSFSSSIVAGTTGIGFGVAVLLPKVGHAVLGGAESVMRTLVRTRSLSAGVKGIVARYPIGGILT